MKKANVFMTVVLKDGEEIDEIKRWEHHIEICWVVVFSWILGTLDNKLRKALASMTNGEVACGVVITVTIYAATYIIGNTIWNRCKSQKGEK